MTASTISKIDVNDVKDLVYTKAKSVYKFLGIINRPEINIVLIGIFFISIIIYSFINNKYKRVIAEWVSTPLITCLSLALVVLISYINFPLGLLLLVGYFIVVYPLSADATSNYYNNGNLQVTSNIGRRQYVMEGFDTNMSDNSASKSMEDKEKDEELADNIKNSITKGITDAKKKGDDDLKALMLQNSKMKLKNEKSKSNGGGSGGNKDSKNNKNSGGSNSGGGIGGSGSNSDETSKKIEKRKFNPSNQDDTNLMITKEMLSDMINRIEYKYEDTPYLKKYLRHRIEDIIETNDLLDDDE